MLEYKWKLRLQLSLGILNESEGCWQYFTALPVSELAKSKWKKKKLHRQIQIATAVTFVQYRLYILFQILKSCHINLPHFFAIFPCQLPHTLPRTCPCICPGPLSGSASSVSVWPALRSLHQALTLSVRQCKRSTFYTKQEAHNLTSFCLLFHAGSCYDDRAPTDNVT